MDLPFDDVMKNGFCWGEYPARIDDTGRLRLPKAIVDVLAQHGISRLWRCPDPGGERFILCLPEHRVTYIDHIQKYLEHNEGNDDAWRLVCAGTEAGIDRQGRISIPNACLRQAGINPPQQVSALGVGFWYEVKVWRLAAGGDSP
jgi:DNA-binding transcriptional regulator/RsmH inhibitor MraZ